MRRGWKLALTLSVILLAAGCGTLPPGESVPVETEPQYTEVEPTSPPATPSQPVQQPKMPITDAAQNLIKKAAKAARTGDYEQAIALLERALRIGPNRAEVYISMAETYRAKGDSAMATAIAERGMLYCSDAKQCSALKAYTH